MFAFVCPFLVFLLSLVFSSICAFSSSRTCKGLSILYRRLGQGLMRVGICGRATNLEAKHFDWRLLAVNTTVKRPGWYPAPRGEHYREYGYGFIN